MLALSVCDWNKTSVQLPALKRSCEVTFKEINDFLEFSLLSCMYLHIHFFEEF